MISILPGRPVLCMISESPSRSPISLLTIASEPLLAIASHSRVKGHSGGNRREEPAVFRSPISRCKAAPSKRCICAIVAPSARTLSMNDPASAEDLPTFTSSYLVIDDFLPMELALSMRADIDRHFGEPAAHQPHTHQVWNYWYVPGTYTYLRTQPERLMGDDKVKTFMATLREYTAARLGMSFVMPPILSLYVDGCNQQFHNDATNGRFAFVYSLTNPVRQTIGGATILMHEGDLFRGHLASPMAIRGFCDLIEPRFNRLLIFDDRVFHAVERVEGSMDPV